MILFKSDIGREDFLPCTFCVIENRNPLDLHCLFSEMNVLNALLLFQPKEF